jgi:hypothetical protein
MPDDAKPQPPIDLTLDFETATAKPAPPPAEPINLDWFEPVLPVVPAVAVAVPVESLPEAVPIPVVVPRVNRPSVAVRPATAPDRLVQANPAPEFRRERPSKSRPLLAGVVVLGLMLAASVAVLVLMVAIYKGFEVFGKPRTNPTAATPKR